MYISSARATLVMAGPAVLFRVVDTCIPLLEDGTDIDELVSALGTPAARPLVSHLVGTLDGRGLMLHLDQLQVGEPGADVRARFPETLAYLETYQDDPYADFARIRSSRVVVAGPAEALGTATRGLLRAGIGRVLVATSEPDRLARLAARNPEVELRAWCESAPFPSLVDDLEPDAAIVVVADAFPADTIERLPTGCIGVAVRLGKDLAIVGPAIFPGTALQGVEDLWSRAGAWCRGGDLLVRPSGDLLAGALAAQVAFDALIGRNAGQTHLVHGPDLSADAIATAVAAQPTEHESATEWPPVPTSPASADWRDSLSAPWTGLFQLSVPGALPQMPQALTLAEGRSRWFDGRAVGIGADQETSTTEAALAALRRHGDGLLGADEPLEGPVFAAGLDATEWLLDGALRLLSRCGGDEVAVEWLGIDDPEGRRLWRALEEYELLPITVTSCQPADFGWVLVTVRDRRDGSVLSRGWGPTRAVGAVAALSSALATQQVRRWVDFAFAGASPEAGFVSHLHRSCLDDLTAALESWLGANGHGLRGRRLAADPVAGPIGAWCGPVWCEPAQIEPAQIEPAQTEPAQIEPAQWGTVGRHG